MFSFILFGGLLGLYCVYNTITNFAADRQIGPLTKQLENEGVIVEEWDGCKARERVEYLNKITEIHYIFRLLVNKNKNFECLLDDRTELYDLIAKMSSMSDARLRMALISIIYWFINEGADRYDSYESRLYELLSNMNKETKNTEVD